MNVSGDCLLWNIASIIMDSGRGGNGRVALIRFKGSLDAFDLDESGVMTERCL